MGVDALGVAFAAGCCVGWLGAARVASSFGSGTGIGAGAGTGECGGICGVAGLGLDTGFGAGAGGARAGFGAGASDAWVPLPAGRGEPRSAAAPGPDTSALDGTDGEDRSVCAEDQCRRCGDCGLPTRAAGDWSVGEAGGSAGTVPGEPTAGLTAAGPGGALAGDPWMEPPCRA